MTEALLIWLYLSLGGFLKVLGIVLIAPFVLTPVLCVFGLPLILELSEEGFNHIMNFFKQNIKKLFGVLIAGLFLINFVPSENDLKYIIGGALVWNGVEAAGELEGVDRLPQNLLDAMNHFLEETMEEEKDQ